MCGGEWWRRRRPDRLLMLVVEVVAAHDAADVGEHHGVGTRRWRGGPQCDALVLLPCRAGSLQGSGAPQESKGRRGGEVEPPAASTGIAAGSLWGSNLIASFAEADLNVRGRGPSRRVPHWREGSGCPASDRTRDAGARFSCGLSCQGVRCRSASGRTPTRIDRGPHSRSSHRSICSAGPRSGSARPSPRAGGLPHIPPPVWTFAAVSAARRSSRQVTRKRNDDEGPTAAQNSLHNNDSNSLPRRPRQRRSVFGPRRVCGTRLERY